MIRDTLVIALWLFILAAGVAPFALAALMSI